MTHTVTVIPFAEAGDVETVWRDLERRSDAAFFLTWDWIGCWLRTSGAMAYLVTVRDGARVVGMALLHPSRQRRHHLLGIDALMLHQLGDRAMDIITIEHNGILADRDHAAVAKQAVIDHLARHHAGAPHWEEIHLGGLPAPEALIPQAAQAGLMTWYHSYKQSWAVDLGHLRGTGTAYLDTLSANTRYQIRRSIRLYAARGPLTATFAATVAEAMEYFDAMKGLHQEYWTARGKPGSFAFPYFEQFHRVLIAECLPKGTVELMRVSAGDEAIGYLYNFISDGWVCAYHTGFRYEADPKLKPGLVSHYLCIEHHLRNGARLYDFLAGNERYKANLANPGPNIADLVIQRPVLKLRFEQAARWVKHAGEQHWMGAVAPEEAAGRKALVLGDDTRSFLAIVRSLGRQGIEVHAAPENFASPALRSRYIARIHYLPYWMGDGAEWLRAFEALLKTENFDLVIPCNETTLLPMQRHRARLERLSRLAVPHDRAIAVLFDKHATRELARAEGVAVSPGRLPVQGESAEAVIAELGLPMVVKARKSYALDALHARSKVKIITSAAELARIQPQLSPDTDLYEGFFPGRGAGVSVLAHEGRVLQAFEHHRQRESGAGGSYYRMSAPLTPALETACAAMVKALDYTGLAMFEFRLDDRAGTWVLLEVNARPWGSMPLPVGLGVDFPYRLYAVLVEGKVLPPVEYRAGVFGRNLLPDLRITLSEARQVRGGPLALLRFAANRIGEFGRLLTGREQMDVLVRDDPMPGLRELLDFAREVARRLGGKLPGVAALRRRRAVHALRRALAGAGSPRILFVCQGNICRSPFGAAALRARLPRVEVASYGMMPGGGRPTPELGIAAAASAGIDLAPHRSAHLSREAAQAATAILVFDEINRNALAERYPDLAAPVLSLGDFADPPVATIEDPVDGDAAMFARIYGLIGRGVEGVAQLINRA